MPKPPSQPTSQLIKELEPPKEGGSTDESTPTKQLKEKEESEEQELNSKKRKYCEISATNDEPSSEIIHDKETEPQTVTKEAPRKLLKKNPENVRVIAPSVPKLSVFDLGKFSYQQGKLNHSE